MHAAREFSTAEFHALAVLDPTTGGTRQLAASSERSISIPAVDFMPNADGNPYEPPSAMSPNSRAARLSVPRALGILFGAAAATAVVGALMGTLLGAFAPDYYRTVFGRSWNAAADPVRVGFGLGLTQGSVVGFVAGIVAVLASALSRRPRAR